MIELLINFRDYVLYPVILVSLIVFIVCWLLLRNKKGGIIVAIRERALAICMISFVIAFVFLGGASNDAELMRRP